MPNKIIVFTIKEHSLWKELWENLETIHCGGWDIKGLFINAGTGVTENNPEKFGENFFTDTKSLPFRAIRLFKDEVKVFLVKQQGEAFDQGLQENANIISIIVRKYAENGDELFLLLHSTGGQVDENYKQISESASIKIYPPREFIHDDTLIFKRIKEWIENKMIDGLDKLLDEIRGDANPHAYIEILEHHLKGIINTIEPNINGLKSAGLKEKFADEWSIMREAMLKGGEGRVENEIKLYKNIKTVLKIPKDICSNIYNKLLKADEYYKGIFKLVRDSSQFAENNGREVLKDGDELIKLLNDIIDKLEGNKNG